MSQRKQLFRFYFLPVGLEMQPVKIYIILQLMLLFFLFFFLSNVWDQFSCAVAHLTGLKLIFILHFLFPSWDTFTSCGFFKKRKKKHWRATIPHLWSCEDKFRHMLSEDLTRTKISGMRGNEKRIEPSWAWRFYTTGAETFLQLFEDDVEAEEDRLVLLTIICLFTGPLVSLSTFPVEM